MRSFTRACLTAWRRSATPGSLALSSTALVAPMRFKSFHFYLNLKDPEDTRRHVEEELERLSDNHKRDTAAYLHSLLNLSLSYYQAEDYITARDFAEYTHQRAYAYNSKSSLLFLTATTCAHCCTKLADEYEAHVAEAEAKAHTSVTLAPRPSVVFSAKRAIRKLREDATRYEGIAARLEARPDLAFMKGMHNPHVNTARRQAYYGEAAPDADQTNAHNQDGDEEEEKAEDAYREDTAAGGEGQYRNPRANATDGTSSSSARANSRARRGMGWQEDANNVDEEFEDNHYGKRWQTQRRRPEHAELKRYYQRQNQGRNGGRYKVPK